MRKSIDTAAGWSYNRLGELQPLPFPMVPMSLGPHVRRTLNPLRRFYRRPVRIAGTLALFAMPAACAFCVETVISPQAQEHTAFCAQYVTENKLVFYNLGWSYFQLGRCHEAYSAFIDALALEPDRLEARKNVTVAMDCLGKQDSAVQRLMDKIRDNPGDPDLHFKLGALFEDRQRYDLARYEFLSTVKLDPEYALAYFRAARLFDRNLQTQETIELCQKFVDLLRDEAHAREKEWCVGRVKELQFR